MTAVKRSTEPLGGNLPSGTQNPCAAPGAAQLADVLADVTAADLARLLEDAPGLPALCTRTADGLEDLAPDLDLDPNPAPPGLEDLTARMNAGLRALALALAALAELLQVARAGREGGNL